MTNLQITAYASTHEVVGQRCNDHNGFDDGTVTVQIFTNGGHPTTMNPVWTADIKFLTMGHDAADAKASLIKNLRRIADDLEKATP